MEIDVYIHGAPCGFGMHGPREQGDYLKTLYNQDQGPSKLLVQVREDRGRAWCYYNFLDHNNIVDNNGRPGSYFGITLRCDCYIMDMVAVHDALEYSYRVFFQDMLLSRSNDVLTYGYPDFKLLAGYCDGVAQRIQSMIQGIISDKPSATESLTDFTKASQTVKKCNLYDFTLLQVRDMVKQDGALSLSPMYHSQGEELLKRETDRLNKQMQGMGRELEMAKGENNTLRSELKQAQAQTQAQIQKAQQLEARNKELESKANAKNQERASTQWDNTPEQVQRSRNTENSYGLGENINFFKNLFPVIILVVGVVTGGVLTYALAPTPKAPEVDYLRIENSMKSSLNQFKNSGRSLLDEPIPSRTDLSASSKAEDKAPAPAASKKQPSSLKNKK